MAEPKGGDPGPIWEKLPRPPMVRAINAVGGGLRRLGVRWPRLDPEAMMAEARRRARLSDFGDGRFREGLGIMVRDFDSRDEVHAFGRVYFREYVTTLLVNRLKIQADLTRHPEILDVPIHRPLFITGLPRSGTTFLHRMMSEDPAGRTLMLWESMEPSPPPETATYATDPRIERARRRLGMLYRLSPRLAEAHEFGATIPEEDNSFFLHEFEAALLGFFFDLPEYTRWLDVQDRLEGYRSARRQMQHLSWKHRADHWVLKAPAHQYGLEGMLGAFPDACVIVTHRDPLKVIPSVCSLAAALRGILVPEVDLRTLGANFVLAMARGPERMMEARAKLDPARFFDVAYDRTVAEPVEVIRDACRHFGYDFTPEYEARVRRYLAANPRHKHGVHRYRLEDFGLDAATVNPHFAGYRAWLADRGIAVGG